MAQDPFLDALAAVRGQQQPAPTDPFLVALDEVRAASKPIEADFSERILKAAAPTALRVGGGIAGTAIGAPAGPGGMMAGGALGSALGEYLAQAVEGRDTNLTEVGIQTGLGAVPGLGPGKSLLSTLGRNMAQGALLNTGATTARSAIEQGELPSFDDVTTSALGGAAFGGAFGGAIEGGRRLVGGLRRIDQPTPRPVPQLPAGSFRAAPDGSVAAPGQAIDMQPPADGSFVRSRRAAISARDESGQPSAFSGDPHASDVPVVPRPVRGLLPGGTARFAASETGDVVSIERVDELARLLSDDTRRVSPDADTPRLVPAAPIARDVDATAKPWEAVKVRQYSGDPNATPAPLLDDNGRKLLEQAGEDLREFTSQRGRLVRDPNDEDSSVFAHGGPGTPIADDIRAIAGTRAGNDVIERARLDLLEGKPPTSRHHTAWLDWAENVRKGTPGYHRPQVAAAAAREAQPTDADDFDQFVRLFDDVEGAPSAVGVREPGQEGFATAQLAAKLGPGLVAGTAGAATGEDTEDRIARAGLGFGLGVAGGAAAVGALQRRSGRLPGDFVVQRGAAQGGRRVINLDELRPINTGPTRASQQATGTPRQDPMKGFDRFLSKFPEPVRNGITERLAANGGFDAQRRGVVNIAEQSRLAERVAVDVSRTLPRGTAPNAEQVIAYTRAADRTMRKVQELASLVDSGNATDADILRFEAAKADHAVVLASLAGQRSEAGRALAAFRFFDRVVGTGDVNLIRAAVKAPGLRVDVEQIARRLTDVGTDPLKRYEFLRGLAAPSLMDKARSYYYANILSGVKTHERNLLGNVFNVLTDAAVQPIAAGVDAVKSAATGAPRTIRLGEMKPGMVGAAVGLEQGLREFAFTLRHGVSHGNLSRTMTAAQRGQFDLPRVELPGGGANPLNYPGRLLEATDALFRSIARESELSRLAFSKARSEGIRDADKLAARMAALRAGTTADAQPLHQLAETYAARAVFQEASGPVVGKFQGIVKEWPALAFVIPFVKTPANILRQGLEFSPAGVLMKAAKQEGRAGTQAQARIAAGTAAAGVLAWLAASGRLSGSGPRNEGERAAKMERGWRPNSIKVGDKWVSYSLFQPVSVQASIVANAFEAWQANRDDGALAAAVSTVFRSIDSFLDQSFLSGLFDVVQAVSRAETSPESMMRTAGRMAHSLTPLAAAQRTVRDAIDPVVRRPETPSEAFSVNVPGVSEGIRPRVSRFGEPVTREGGPLRRAADPFNVSTERPASAIEHELDRLGINLTLPKDEIRHKGQRLELTTAQEVELQQVKGRAVRFALERAVQSPRYDALTDEQKASYLRKQIARARQQSNATQRREVLGLQRRAGVR